MGKKNNKQKGNFAPVYRKKAKSQPEEKQSVATSVIENVAIVRPVVTDGNKASIYRKIVITATIETKSPMRIGSGDNDGITDILILRNKEGNFFIPGTSLTGVLRSEMESIYGTDVVNKLFGHDEDGNQSMLIVNDVVFPNASLTYRDGVAIDPITGTAKPGAKYDYEALAKGARSSIVNIEMTIRYNDYKGDILEEKDFHHAYFKLRKDCYGELAAAIADLLTKGISVGALTAKGFGRIASQNAKCYDFCFENGKDANKWLEYIKTETLGNGELYKGTDTQLMGKNDFYAQICCRLQSSLLIADSNSESMLVQEKKSNGDDDAEPAIQMNNGREIIIPGTSIKGVLRNRALQILLELSNKNLLRAEKFVNEMMGFAKDDSGKGKKSKLFVDELYIDNSKLIPMQQTRVRIDKFTGGAIDKGLFTVEPVWQQDKSMSTINMSLRVKDCNEAEAGLMLLLIKDLWYGYMSIGSGKGVGRGVLNGVKGTIDFKGHRFLLSDNNGQMCVDDTDNLLNKYVGILTGEIND